MRVLIVEDETIAYENLVDIISGINPAIKIVGNTESVRQTVEWLKINMPPHLIFMDVHLSDGSAFAIFQEIIVETPIVFTTAYDKYALEAFKVNSIDYLLKPIKPRSVSRALAKFDRLTRAEDLRYIAQINLLAPREASKYRDRILLLIRNKLEPVRLNEVSCFYSTGGRSLVCLKNGRKIPFDGTLGHIIKTLDPVAFTRANKQYIIARDSVQNITICPDYRLLLKLDVDVPELLHVSKNQSTAFKAWMVKDPAQNP